MTAHFNYSWVENSFCKKSLKIHSCPETELMERAKSGLKIIHFSILIGLGTGVIWNQEDFIHVIQIMEIKKYSLLDWSQYVESWGLLTSPLVKCGDVASLVLIAFEQAVGAISINIKIILGFSY